MGLIVLIILVLVFIGVFPSWPHSQTWGFAPSGMVGFVSIVVIVLLVLGRA